LQNQIEAEDSRLTFVFSRSRKTNASIEAITLLNFLNTYMTTIAVIGLGYVGLPLAIEFGKHFSTIGYDLSKEKVASYRAHKDPTGEVQKTQFEESKQISFTTEPSDLSKADFFVVAVPTPVNEAHQPDFSPLVSASEFVGKQMSKGSIVVYESTVYPGATEEICIPILEKVSGLKWLTDFHVGYSPERINPGDKVHTLPNIVKVVSGDDEATLEKVASVYGTIITAGVHKASSIKVAEAAKVIENTQRDLNIALMNELSLIFNRIGISTADVLKAAGTKWNFLNFRPGLVGGHCIGVDPYYLTHKAEKLGYIPQVILAGRRINDAMGPYVARQAIKQMIQKGLSFQDATVVVLGLTFKENVPDLRNSKVIDVIRELQSYGLNVKVHDPIASSADAEHEYGVSLCEWSELNNVSAVIMAVNHDEYLNLGAAKIQEIMKPNSVFIDVKSAFSKESFNEKGISVWQL
jgi:UDP-N-acetyl-D-glucosamine/UDP-N-acetyl-D-galactosamine dehydrogenase